jgi:hypothetical protein
MKVGLFIRVFGDALRLRCFVFFRVLMFTLVTVAVAAWLVFDQLLLQLLLVVPGV